jgi:probable F420-dependent oxidoreductase
MTTGDQDAPPVASAQERPGNAGKEVGMDLGRVGIWSGQLRRGDPDQIRDAAAELDRLGFSALWIPGGAGGDVLGDAERLLGATTQAVVATGILNVWMHVPADVASGHARLTGAHPGRFLLGLGVSHAPLIERANQVYRRPLAKMVDYLDRLDAASPPVPRSERALAALAPNLVTPEHTAVARGVLGSGPLLAPEQKVVLDTDADRARSVARQHLDRYLQLPNYTNNLLRTGFTDDDIAGGGSDRLIDGLVAWGDLDVIAARVRAHHDAGADHVCLQVLLADASALPTAEWRRLAEALIR